MFDLAPLMIGTTARSGPSQWLAEAVATFTLILTILGGLRYAPQSIPWLVGLVITAAYWFTSSTSFANPAVTLARAFTTTFAGIAINHVPAFIVAQIVGALIAAAVATVLFPSAVRKRGDVRDSSGASWRPGSEAGRAKSWARIWVRRRAMQVTLVDAIMLAVAGLIGGVAAGTAIRAQGSRTLLNAIAGTIGG